MLRIGISSSISIYSLLPLLMHLALPDLVVAASNSAPIPMTNAGHEEPRIPVSPTAKVTKNPKQPRLSCYEAFI